MVVVIFIVLLVHPSPTTPHPSKTDRYLSKETTQTPKITREPNNSSNSTFLLHNLYIQTYHSLFSTHTPYFSSLKTPIYTTLYINNYTLIESTLILNENTKTPKQIFKKPNLKNVTVSPIFLTPKTPIKPTFSPIFPSPYLLVTMGTPPKVRQKNTTQPPQPLQDSPRSPSRHLTSNLPTLKSS